MLGRGGCPAARTAAAGAPFGLPWPPSSGLPSVRPSVPRRPVPGGRVYGADVSERSSCSCYSSDHSYERGGCPPDGDPLVPPCPAWKLRGYGTGAGPGPHAAGTQPPWFAVGVSRADGTQVEVVAAVVDGRVRLEEVRADPPLPLQEFARLAPCLREPLTKACPSAIRPPQTDPTSRTTGACALPAAQLPVSSPHAAPALSEPPPPPPPPAPGTPSSPPAPGTPPSAPAPGTPPPSPASPPTPYQSPPLPSAPPPQPAPAAHMGSSPARARGRRRPRAPRGREALRAAAEAYSAARERGQDPVLAVMRITGHSRRKSLRVIASARDAGLLSPRHARR
ncbi:DUF6214 family protein [Streptomyces sp. 3N207]|uniref:DUF6214 family protein n=1 Tax=Streptomyces sp. 3N207 TaxID=3457417 RepID=UPI003FCF9555